MSKLLGLDPDKFKHVKSDDKSTTLRHKDGHTLTIAHNVLSPRMQAQLKALSKVGSEAETETQSAERKSKYGKVIVKEAEGGEICMDEGGKVPAPATGHEQKKVYSAKEIAKGSQQPVKSASLDSIMSGWWDAPKKAEGGKVQQYAKGEVVAAAPPSEAEVEAAVAEPKSEIPSEAEVEAAVDEPKAKAEPPGLSEHLGAIVGKVGTQAVKDALSPWITIAHGVSRAADEAGKFGSGVMSEVEKSLPPEPPEAKELPPENKMASTEIPSEPMGSSQPAPMPDIPQPQAESKPEKGMPGYEDLLKNAYNMGIESADVAAAAQAKEGQQKARALKNQVKADEDAQLAFQTGTEEINSEYNHFVNDMKNGYVDPNKFWTGYTAPNGDKVPGHSKVLTGIGMILAGFNPTNSPNAAIEMFRHQMEQSLEAQKQNLNSSHNLLRANLDHFKNFRDAADFTRVQMAAGLSHMIDQAAAKAQGPMAQSAALKMKSDISQQVAPLMLRLGMQQGLAKLANGQAGNDPSDTSAAERMVAQMGIFDPEAAKYQASKIVPGVGISASQPVPEKVRDELISHKKFDAAAKDLYSFIDQHRGKLSSLNPADRALAAQKAIVLQSLFREGTLGTVYREGEQPLLDKAIRGQPLSLLSYFTELPKLKGLMDTNDRMFTTLKSGYGIPSARQVQHDQASQVVTGKDGRQYYRVGNVMRPVK